jgi:hypothetical protein
MVIDRRTRYIYTCNTCRAAGQLCATHRSQIYDFLDWLKTPARRA